MLRPTAKFYAFTRTVLTAIFLENPGHPVASLILKLVILTLSILAAQAETLHFHGLRAVTVHLVILIVTRSQGF